MTTTGGSMFLPIRSKSTGRYLCDYDPQRQLLRFKRGQWEEIIDLAEHAPPERLEEYARRLARLVEWPAASEHHAVNDI